MPLTILIPASEKSLLMESLPHLQETAPQDIQTDKVLQLTLTVQKAWLLMLPELYMLPILTITESVKLQVRELCLPLPETELRVTLTDKVLLPNSIIHTV